MVSTTVTIIVLAIYGVVMTVKYCIVTNESRNVIDDLHRQIRILEDNAK